ncbi:ABC transporter substrate-binding protein [uncultured Jatrophihabitans sp.]|uniref:ABC transporter substrate-binding protein n=1 Tax=uncultured Jatrophihabitans sp. TaxID=1610747 RepID=UPI0035CB388D
MATVLLVLAACSGPQPSSRTRGVTITVADFFPAPPASTLAEFTKQTGIKVNWTTVDFDSLQTKIATSAVANTYFADVTDVDWSRVGQLARLKWFYPMETLLDADQLRSTMPQLRSFEVGGHLIGVPFDASFLVTTVNTAVFRKAGITTMPTTISRYTDDLKKIKAAGVVKYPLDIPFAAAEGLSTYWYQTTAAFGGSVLDAKQRPQFTATGSAGHRAAQWMVDAIRKGLVPPGNINVSDTQGQATLMAKGQVASVFGDYSGNVGSLYNVRDSSTVTGKVAYLRTPGVSATAGNVSNPDGLGIPKLAKYPQAAAKFIQWVTQPDVQAGFAGGQGSSRVLSGYFLPSRTAGVTKLIQAKALSGGGVLSELLRNSARPAFPGGSPSWYPEFSRAVYSNLHAAAAGSESVQAALNSMASTARKLAKDA